MTSVTRRGIVGGLLDKVFGWVKGLPPELCNYSVQRLHIPLQDKTEVTADLYRPANFEPAGTVLVRSPYGIGFPSCLALARIYASRGYQVLISNCRGTFESGDQFEPGRNETEDGNATVAWMREQSWYTGSFATLGGSYLGFNQWALLSEPPHDMKAAVITTGPHSFANFIWGTGALSSNIIAWADIQARMKGGILAVIPALRSQQKRLRPVFDSTPLLDGVDKHFHGKAPEWLHQVLIHSDVEEDYFKPMHQTVAFEKADIPILLTAGWNDLIFPNVMDQYETLQRRGCDVALTVGPWGHLEAQNTPSTLLETLKWLDHRLSHRVSESRASPVHIFVTGAEEWCDLPKWPPPTTPHELCLAAGKKLSPNTTASSEASDSTFNFDPANPTPSIAHPLLFDNGPGRKDSDGALSTRSDVLTFETEPLDQDINVYGKPHVKLHHSTSHPHADIFILLSEVDRNGRSSTITERFLRLGPDRPPTEPISLDLQDCAHRFRIGGKIRLLIAGGSHPRFIRNLGTGEDPVRGEKMQVVKHMVRYGGDMVSKLVLPVSQAV